MFLTITKLFKLLSRSQKYNYFTLQIFIIFMVVIEIIGIAAIFPFMALVSDTNILQDENLIAQIYQVTNFNSEYKFILFFGLSVLVFLFISTIISTLTSWKLSMFGIKVGTEIADKLYSYYLRQNWLFHVSNNSAKLTKQIANETTRVTVAVLTPIMQINARIILVLIIGIIFFIISPKIALISLIIFGSVYFIFFLIIKKKVGQYGKNVSQMYEKRFLLMNEGFGGIRDIKLLGKEKNFIENFSSTGQKLAYSLGATQALSQVPRYFIELVAFGSAISLVLYYNSFYSSDMSKILPIISIYAAAGLNYYQLFNKYIFIPLN